MRVNEIAERIPADAAQLAVARILAILGSQFDWDSSTLDYVAEAVAPSIPRGVPSVFDQDGDAVVFWQEVDG